jgi:Fur family ferric uptake transcriptional regulator
MKADKRVAAKNILDDYLEANNCRKTAERYAILSAAYDIGTSFTIVALSDYLKSINMAISMATLYSALSLFEQLQIVVCHRFPGETLYEACLGKNGTVFQVCTVCGKIKNISLPAVGQVIINTKISKFKKSYSDVIIYGICSRCQAAKSHSKNKISLNKNKSKSDKL